MPAPIPASPEEKWKVPFLPYARGERIAGEPLVPLTPTQRRTRWTIGDLTRLPGHLDGEAHDGRSSAGWPRVPSRSLARAAPKDRTIAPSSVRPSLPVGHGAMRLVLRAGRRALRGVRRRSGP